RTPTTPVLDQRTSEPPLRDLRAGRTDKDAECPNVSLGTRRSLSPNATTDWLRATTRRPSSVRAPRRRSRSLRGSPASPATQRQWCFRGPATPLQGNLTILKSSRVRATCTGARSVELGLTEAADVTAGRSQNENPGAVTLRLAIYLNDSITRSIA